MPVPARPQTPAAPAGRLTFNVRDFGGQGDGVAGNPGLNARVEGSAVEAQADGAPGFGGTYDTRQP